MIYEYYKEKAKKHMNTKLVILFALVLIIFAAIISVNIYSNIIQLDEMGGYSTVYIRNLIYRIIFSGIAFLIMFATLYLTTLFIRKNLKKHIEMSNLTPRKFPILSISLVISIIGAYISNAFFYKKALSFLNSTIFGLKDPIFNVDIGYYVFQRPFLMSIYEFVLLLWIFIIFYTIAYYLFALIIGMKPDTDLYFLKDFKIKSVLRHNLINIAILFIIKAFSYKFQKEGILYSSIKNDIVGGGYIDINIWMSYFKVMPFLLIVITLVAFYFIWKGMLKRAAYCISIFPAIWIIVIVSTLVIQSFIVKPNELNYQKQYLKYNIEKTREAFKLDKIKTHDFPSLMDLTPQIINQNKDTKDNIRVVHYDTVLDSNKQLQSNTNFYTFDEGDIINYAINGKEIPILISAREIDKDKIPDKSYINKMLKYTHGYGIVINPINKVTSEGQVDFILSGLRMDSDDKNLKVSEPRIYYGELTNDQVIVNASGIKEVDYDGNKETVYTGKGGIKLGLFNKALFALKNHDLNLLISGYVSNNSKLLLNRQVITRAKKALPFLQIDEDAYVVLTDDGRLKWVLDAYTSTEFYPYSQNYKDFNYIRNSAKIVIDAYNGDVKCYIIDKNDPIIMQYKKIYPEVLIDKPLPDGITKHLRYPEYLFRIQTEMMKKYHLTSKDVDLFYTKQDMWNIAMYSSRNKGKTVEEIDPYYNMIKLPEDIGNTEELILMRPFTPSGGTKHNLVSWLAVRNSADTYGEMILFNFPKNKNIFGPNQIDVKINQIDKISKDMSLWNQSGSEVYKGDLLVIPINDSVLYVQPIYIKAAGQSSIPEMREIVVGFQQGDEFKFGYGNNLDAALNELFKEQGKVEEQKTQVPQKTNEVDESVINEILSKYDSLKKGIDEIGDLIGKLKK